MAPRRGAARRTAALPARRPTDDDMEERRNRERRLQEEMDHALAMRLQDESYSAPTPRRSSQSSSTTASSTSRRGGRNGMGATRGRRVHIPSSSSGSTSSSSASSSNRSQRSGSTPIRRVAPPNRTGRPANPRERAARISRGEPALMFQGDRLITRQGNDVIDLTNEAYFPDDDEDGDYEETVSSDGDSDSGSEISAEDAEEVDTSQDTSSRRTGSSSTASSRQSQRGGRGGRGANRPAVSGNFIRMLLQQAARPDHSRDYTPPVAAEEESDSSSDESVDDEDMEDTEVVSEAGSNGTIEILDSDDEEEEDGPIRADRNHIQQPIFDEDRDMYHRELDLYLNDNEYVVPPPKEQTYKGKPIEPDATWGDCTICSNTPVKPKGCNKCLQFLGCSDCIDRWHATRCGSDEGPSCPLCRAQWGSRPSVVLMPTIEKRREKENSKASSSAAGPSTSSSK